MREERLKKGLQDLREQYQVIDMAPISINLGC